MRRQEVVRLDVEDFDNETGAVMIRAGKGRKDRTAYASNGSLAALQAWLALRGPEPGPLFVPVMKGGRMVMRQMIPHAVYKTVSKRAREAGVQAFSPPTSGVPSSPTSWMQGRTSRRSSRLRDTLASRPP